MEIPAFVVALLQSRKFWIAVVTAVAATVLAVRGEISAEQLADVYAALAAIVIGAIAIEDSAAKFGSGKS